MAHYIASKLSLIFLRSPIWIFSTFFDCLNDSCNWIGSRHRVTRTHVVPCSTQTQAMEMEMYLCNHTYASARPYVHLIVLICADTHACTHARKLTHIHHHAYSRLGFWTKNFLFVRCYVIRWCNNCNLSYNNLSK